MGNYLPGQEKGIEEIRSLSQEAKNVLSHHILNELNVITGGIETGQLKLAEQAAWHINKDLRELGILE